MNNLNTQTAYVGSTEITQVRKGDRLVLAPNGNKLWYDSNELPSLDLRFAEDKSLVDATTGSNLVDFTRASSATYVGSDGLIKTATTNEARFDHDPDTLESLGLLIEETRTNNALYSGDFNNGAWAIQTGHGLTSNTTIAPDGTQTADTFNRGATNQYIYQSIGITGTYTMSVWVKTPSGAGNLDFVMQHYNGVDGGLGVTTFTATEEWQRFHITASPTVGGGWYPCVPTTLSQDYHVWGAQVEQGSFPTSYIPTSGSTVTRAADVASITGANFSSWYRQDEGTVFVNQTSLSTVPQDFATVFQFNDATVTNILYLRKRPGFSQWVASGESALFMTRTISQPSVLSVAYKTDDAAFAAEGTLTNDTSCTIDPNKVELVIGSSTGSAAYMNGTIRRLTYWPTRLENDTLQTITQ